MGVKRTKGEYKRGDKASYYIPQEMTDEALLYINSECNRLGARWNFNKFVTRLIEEMAIKPQVINYVPTIIETPKEEPKQEIKDNRPNFLKEEFTG